MTRVVGVLGGMGPSATVHFFAQLLAQTAADRDQDHLHVIVDNDSTIPDRTDFLRGRGKDPRPQLLASARRLVDSGCDLLVMPCNTAHAFADDIRRSVPTPFIDWIDVSSDAAAGRGERVGLIATVGTLETGLYQRALRARGSEAVVPEDADQRSVMEAIYGIKVAGVTIDTERRLETVARALHAKGADVLLLACTELALLSPSTVVTWPLPAIDPGVAVARRVVALAGARLVQAAREPPPSPGLKSASATF